MAAVTAPTIASALRDATARLRAAGSGTPELDARVLASHVTGLTAAELIANTRSVLDERCAARLDALLARRAAGEPVARIIGRREFWGLDFALNAHTLVPRPDSETLVEAALEMIDRGAGRHAPLKICDLGTGSGCLLVALLSELPAAWGIGTDLRAEAATIARDNAQRNGVGRRAAFAAMSWTGALGGSFDVIVANPPYIPRGDIASLSREVGGYEPRLSLDGGGDGLAAYRALLPLIAERLAPGGLFLAEFGAGQARDVAGMLSGSRLQVQGIWRDLAGLERVIAAQRREISACGQKPLGKRPRTG
jgi:release factor glutamine methyltransferase